MSSLIGTAAPTPVPVGANPAPSAAPTVPPYSGSGKTWYVRADGGTRYSAARIAAGMSGQCNGLADAAYPGSGVNQNCAFNDFRFLYDDQTNGNSAWVISGGDTVILRGGPWRVGFDNPTGTTWCNGGSGPQECVNPTIPAGTASAHTRILGENYATCNNGAATNTAKLTQLFGGYGLWEALNLDGAAYVDVECLEITRHSQCVLPTSWPLAQDPMPVNSNYALCNKGNPSNANLDDFDDDGVDTDVHTHDIFMQDLWIHGHTGSGLQGPIGGKITMSRMNISFNGMAGWNFDDGSDTPDGAGSSIVASYVSMIGNGCDQEYPANPSHTFGAIACYDLLSDGFGDSWSGQDTNLDSFNCDHCTMAYNTKDGFIGPHTLIGSLSITNSASYGNMGEQWKWVTAPGSTTVFENNLTIGNCSRLDSDMAGAPSGYNTYLSDFCRASGDFFSVGADANSTVSFINNTTVGYSDTMFDLHCNTSGNCASTPFIFKNNIMLAFANPNCNNSQDGCRTDETTNAIYLNDSTVAATGDHNLFFNLRYGCPVSATLQGTCADPLFVGEPALTMSTEASLDNFNFNLGTTSPAISTGVAIPGLTTDYNGTAYGSPPNIGAY